MCKMFAVAVLKLRSRHLLLGTGSFAAALVLSFAGSTASAQVCAEGESGVAVEFEGDAWPSDFRAQVTEELRASMRDQGFVLCEGAGSSGAIARIIFHSNTLPSVELTIEVQDDVTQKELRRDVDLGEFTRDSRAFALAVAGDELLRASWVELSMADANVPPEVEVPAPVERAVRRSIDPSYSRGNALTLSAAAEVFGGGDVHLGGDLNITLTARERWAIELFIGGRRGIEQTLAQGTVSASVLHGGLSLLLGRIRMGPLTLDVPLMLRVGVLIYDPVANTGSLELSTVDAIVSARSGLRLALDLDGISLVFVGGVGAVLLGARPIGDSDEGAAVSGVSGFANLGVSFEL